MGLISRLLGLVLSFVFGLVGFTCWICYAVGPYGSPLAEHGNLLDRMDLLINSMDLTGLFLGNNFIMHIVATGFLRMFQLVVFLIPLVVIAFGEVLILYNVTLYPISVCQGYGTINSRIEPPGIIRSWDGELL